MTDQLVTPQSVSLPQIQRKCAACEREDEKKLQRKEAAGSVPGVTADVQAGIRSLQGTGQPLSQSERDFFEPRFGRDFSHVRVHTDSQAASLASQLNAKAFTVGEHIAFASGQYATESSTGQSLLAHELTHTVQQGASAASIQRQPDEVLESVAQESLSSPANLDVDVAAEQQVNESRDPFLESEVAKKVSRPDGRWVVVVAPSGIRLHATPSSSDVFYKERTHHAAHVYPQWTRLYLIGTSGPENSLSRQWAAVTTSSGIAGWIERRHLSTQFAPEDPEVLDHHVIKKGERLQSLIQKTYSGTGIIQYGQDERAVAEAIVYVNRLSPENPVQMTGKYEGSFIKDKILDRDMAKARELFAKARLVNGRLIKLPTIEHIEALVDKGIVSSRSDWKDAAGELTRSIEGFMAGLPEGFTSAAVDNVTGLWDLVKNIFTGEIVGQVERLFKQIVDLGWEGIWNLLGSAFSEQLKKIKDWFEGVNPLKKWRATGQIFGMILFEIALAVLTAGAVAVASKSARVMAAVNRVRAMTSKIPSVGQIKGKLQAGVGRLKEEAGQLIDDFAAGFHRPLAAEGVGPIPNQGMFSTRLRDSGSPSRTSQTSVRDLRPNADAPKVDKPKSRSSKSVEPPDRTTSRKPRTASEKSTPPRLSWNEFRSRVSGHGYSQKQISRMYKKYLSRKGVDRSGTSKRLQYLGATPGKKSATGRAVIERMRAEGRVLDTPAGTFVKDTDGVFYPLAEMDMGHRPLDAVVFWNTKGIMHGPKSQVVRQWMLDPNNYELQHFSRNRSLGARLGETYIDP